MPERRVLRVVQADVAEPVGDQSFVISEFLLGGLLAQVENKQHRYVTGTVVWAPDAAALAAAISKIETTPDWEIGRAINGDATGEGVMKFCAWLRRGAFEIVDGQGGQPEEA